MITRRGVEVPKTDAVMASKVRRELQVAPLSLTDPFPKKFKVYQETPTHFVVPLHWARQHMDDLRDARGRGETASLTFRGSLRDDLCQREAVRGVLDAWKTSGGGAMLCLPPGYGKTTCALYLAAIVKRKTLVMVHKSFLMDQWVERVRQCLPGATVTTIRGDTVDMSGDVVVAMIQTLVSRRYPPSMFECTGLCIVDECHHLAAATFSQSMWGQCAPYTLALSATPDRKDGLTRVVTWFAGPVAFRMRRENQSGTIVHILKYSCPRYADPPPVNRRGDICFTSIMTSLVSDENRTRAVADEAVLLAKRDRHVLVLSHRRQHVAELAAAIAAQGVDVGTYVGGDKACPDTRVIVATFALTSEGFDVPRLDALVLATPASDVEQACGRVMRGSSGRGSVIVDVVDEWGVCFAQHAKRRALYKRSGFTIHGYERADAEPSETETTTQFLFV